MMLGIVFFSPSTALAGPFKNKLTDADWIILQIPIPFPGCSNAKLAENIKCCDDPDIKNFYNEKNSALDQTYKNYAPICPSGSVAAVKDVPSFILVAVQFMTIVIIIMMVLLMVVSGIQYITSFGNADKAKKSLERVKHGAFGLVIVLFSSVILYQVNPKLLTLSINKVDTIEEATLIEHCPEEGTVNCGEKIGTSYCQGRKCQLNYYCAEIKKDSEVQSLNCEARLDLGKDCEINDQCLSSFCAISATDLSKKICTDVKAVLAKNCNTNADCQGLFCHKRTGLAGQCTFGRTANNCSNDTECDGQVGYKCLNDRCTIANTPFSRCEEDTDCASGSLCGEGVYYNTAAGNILGSDNDMKTCLPPSKNNATLSTEVYSCDDNGDCAMTPFNTPYCNLYGDNFCTLGLVGNPCDKNDQCATKFCYTFANICTYGATGDSCLTNDQCSSGYCFKNTSGRSNYCLDKPGSTSAPAPALGNQPQQ